MIRQLPVIPTILVVAAAGIMVWLGFWQLGRADEKAAMIAEFEQKAALTEVIEIERGEDELAYRSVRLSCPEPRDWRAIAGRNARGQSGYAHRFLCHDMPSHSFVGPNGLPYATYADIGWSVSPDQPPFEGGTISGILVRMGEHQYKVVATEPEADLQPLAKPDPNDLPNNHLAYAGQWFFFALTALIVYWFAVQSRLKKRD